ncbi:DHA2 family efflux MFS transporter permease subunit [Solirubrobacter phytolaccae]|uniref:DHA2 family efflux MFS transporter permease subunit n=1 Tax=Solirubrobacter phytolaccae TaxID=1404360 RepID=A0A9X3N9Z9_9ACTN|nr:DHA2 family efflux MFS transporter permease subunit [Solirubrobacter phytolaccae]MDA0178842.1 DHA2 family efflux MFS transporter permease subunit [Solirubrobacter phytolaccae]
MSAVPMTHEDETGLTPELLRLSAVLLLGAIAAILDTTIVAVAIDRLGDELGTTLSTIQWVSTGYLLALTVAIPLTGWAVDRFGGRRMWMFSLTGFLGGSVLCGLAWSAESLIAFRVVQGLGGGMLVPLMQSILAQAAGPKRIGRAMAIVAIPAQLGPILGPVVGGLIVDGASWRWIFFVNVPVCLVALALAWRWMPDTRHENTRSRLDFTGLALLSPALAGIVYGLSQAGDAGGFGASSVLVPLGIGLALLTGFVVHALRTSNVPIIDVRLLKVRSFAASTGLMFALGGSLFGAMFLLPLFEQVARDRSALQAGLLLAPQGAGTMIALVIAGRLSDRIAPRILVLTGLALGTLSTLPYALVETGTSELLLGAALFVRGAGLGLAIVPTMTAFYADISRAEIPRATASMRIIQQIGGSLGTAVLAVILQHALAGEADATAAFATTFWWTVGLAGVALIPALLLPSRRAAA